MSIALTAVDPRSQRRVRLVFSHALSVGAFSSLAFYSVTSDGAGVSPAVNGAFLVPSSPNVVELSVTEDLLDGAQYTVSAVGVPATDSTTTPPGTVLSFRRGASPQSVRVDDSPADDLLTEIYGEDLAWNGRDMVEDATGDLGRATGVANVMAAQERRLTSDGLQWDRAYGAKPRQYVDGPYPSVARLRGVCVQQAVQDDRVRRAEARFVPPTAQQRDTCAIEVTALLVGGIEATVQAPVKVG